MRRLWTLPYVRRYLTGQSLSILGDTSMWLAMVIWVRELTGSNGKAGLSFFFMAAPSMAGPLWGAAVDRFRRRPILIGVNAAAGLMTLSLLFVQGRGQVWLIWLVLVGYGVSNSVLGAAQQGYLDFLVPDEFVGDAQGVLSTVREGLRLVSPLIGAGLFTLAGGHVVAIIDAGTFAVACASVASISLPEPAPVRVVQRLRTELAAGWAHIRDTVQIRQVETAFVAVCAVVGFTETAIVAVVTDGLNRSASWLGPLEAVMGIGAIAGGLTVAAAMRRIGEGRVMAIGLAIFALGDSVLVVPTIATAVAGSLIAGFALPWAIAAANTLVMRLTPSNLQGRVSTALDVLTGTPQALSIALGAGLVSVVGYQALLGAVGAVTLVAGIWLFTRPEQRVVRTSDLPDRGLTALEAAAMSVLVTPDEHLHPSQAADRE